MARARTRNPEYAWQPRRRPLVVLSDQGPPKTIPTGLFSLPGRDRTWNPHACNFLSANRANLSALEVEAQLVPSADEVTLRLKPGGVVGAVPLRAPDTRKIAAGLVVKPRFGWDDIGLLLHRVGWSARPRVLEMPLVPGSAKEVPPWVLAGPILQRIAQLLREIRRGFRMHEEVRQSPRGQVLWDRYVHQQMARGAFHQLPCRYPQLGPDLLLQSYLRWGVERVHGSLAPFTVTDVIARTLSHEAEGLLLALGHVRARVPDRRCIEQMLLGSALPSDIFRQGLQALGWLVDERGLAGPAEMDGLAWAMPMHQLFERWVEHIVQLWSHGFGGQVRSASQAQTTVPIRWSRRGRTSLGSLIPDLVVRHGEDVYIIDAKYKGHFEELDDHRWSELADDLRSEHRHDLHQVLAYASIYEARRITAVLAYPMFPGTWLRLGRAASISADLTHAGRELRLVLTGLPLEVPAGTSTAELAGQFEALRLSNAQFGLQSIPDRAS